MTDKRRRSSLVEILGIDDQAKPNQGKERVDSLQKRKSRKSVFPIPEEEDNGALIRQLMLGMQDVINQYTKAPKSLAEAMADPFGSSEPQNKKTVAEALLNCMQKIVDKHRSQAIQFKLQDFIIEFLSPPAQKCKAPEIDIEARIQQRKKFWAPLRTNCNKWNLGGDRLEPTEEEKDKTFMTSVTTASTGMSPGKDTLRSIASSKLSLKSKTDRFPNSKGYSTLRSFGTVEGQEKLSPLTTISDDPGVQDAKRKRIVRLPWGAVNGDIGHCHICQRKARCFIQGQEFKPVRRRRQPFFCPPCLQAQQQAQDSQVDSESSSQGMKRVSSLPAIRQDSSTKTSGWLPNIHPNLDGTDKNSLTRFRSAQRTYFTACEKQLVLPRVPSFLLDQGDYDSNVHLHDQELLDRDLLPLVDPIINKGVESLDLSKNYFTDDGMRSFLEAIPSDSLSSLNISFSGAADASVGQLADLMRPGCRFLHHLHLGGCVLNDHTWNSLCDALVEHSNIRSLKLPECQLGRMSQQSPIRVAGLLPALPFLECLDLSGNFFFDGGFEALAENLGETMSLTELNMSHNASSHLIPPKRMKMKTASKPGIPEFEEVTNFNPVLLLCEGLRRNVSLEKLHLSSSNIDYSADFVLCASLNGHAALEHLDLSSNPHGEDGLRALLRVLMPTQCRIVYCDVSSCRDSKIDNSVVKYNFAEPRGRYSLDLAHPQHRSVLRQLLSAPEQASQQSRASDRKSMSQINVSGSIDSCFRNLQIDPCLQGKWFWKDEHGWGVPTQGKIQLEFIWSQEFQRTDDPAETVRCYYRSRRVAITMGRFVTLYGMYEKLRDSFQRTMMIRAMHDQILLKMAHLRKLIELSPELLELLVNMLYSSVEAMDSMALFDLIKRPDANRRFRKVARSHFFFNDSNPTDHYELDLEVPMQFSVAEKVAILNAWESLPANVVDTTQYGRGEGVRNAIWEGRKVESFIDFSIPPQGLLSMDYVSPKGPNPRLAAMSENCFDAIMEKLRNTECSHEDRVCALRSISHLMVVDAGQVRAFCEEVPNHNILMESNPNARRSVLIKMHRATAKVKAMSNLGLALKESAFQYDDFNPRLEAFVCFFNRCKEQIELCTERTMYHDKLFTTRCSASLRNRLGVLRTFDALHCAEETTNCGNRFVCRLWIHEEWQLAKFLVKLSAIEDGVNMVKTKWTEASFMTDQGYDFNVPEAWLSELPTVGTFSLNYIEEKLEYRNVGERRKLAEQICGWPFVRVAST